MYRYILIVYSTVIYLIMPMFNQAGQLIIAKEPNLLEGRKKEVDELSGDPPPALFYPPHGGIYSFPPSLPLSLFTLPPEKLKTCFFS